MIPTAAREHRGLRLAAAGLVAAAVAYPLAPFSPTLCPLRATTGVPCPFCGMTRAVVAAVHGHVLQSLAFNPGGIFVVLIAAVLLVRPELAARVRRPPLWALWALLGALWLWNVGFSPTFHQLLLPS
ncbi:MAG TPA: DUF2752 domain-containing protein [Acidimicrobiia bacterium]|nr:DUF2752 domain-containing protein [Acidimicrobiia bacterium]